MQILKLAGENFFQPRFVFLRQDCNGDVLQIQFVFIAERATKSCEFTQNRIAIVWLDGNVVDVSGWPTEVRSERWRRIRRYSEVRRVLEAPRRFPLGIPSTAFVGQPA